MHQLYDNNPIEDYSEYIRLIKFVFSSPEGKQLLNTLTEQFVNRPAYYVGIDSLELAFRDGQRDVISYLNDIMKSKITEEDNIHD